MGKFFSILFSFIFLFAVSACNTGLHTTTQVGGMNNDQNHHNSTTNVTTQVPTASHGSVINNLGMDKETFNAVAKAIREPLIKANQEQIKINKDQTAKLDIITKLNYDTAVKMYKLEQDFNTYKRGRQVRDQEVVKIMRSQKAVLMSAVDLKKKYSQRIALSTRY